MCFSNFNLILLIGLVLGMGITAAPLSKKPVGVDFAFGAGCALPDLFNEHCIDPKVFLRNAAIALGHCDRFPGGCSYPRVDVVKPTANAIEEKDVPITTLEKKDDLTIRCLPCADGIDSPCCNHLGEPLIPRCIPCADGVDSPCCNHLGEPLISRSIPGIDGPICMDAQRENTAIAHHYYDYPDGEVKLKARCFACTDETGGSADVDEVVPPRSFEETEVEVRCIGGKGSACMPPRSLDEHFAMARTETDDVLARSFEETGVDVRCDGGKDVACMPLRD